MDEKSPPEMPKHETFGQRVVRLRLAAGFQTPSDLARALWGEKRDKRGFMVANNRDTIWRYENDKGRPNRRNTAKLAEALGVAPEVLDPERNRAPQKLIPSAKPQLELVTLPDGRYRLTFSGALDLPPADAMKLFQDIEAWWQHSNKTPDDTMEVTFEEPQKPAKATPVARSRAPLIAPTETLPNPLKRKTAKAS